MKNLCALLCGILFGLGLAISGMTDTQKVIGFLDLFGNWQPDLIFVMAGAVILTFIGFQFVLKKQTPVCDNHFYLPEKKSLDVKLILGALIFGIGWGLYGYCPGPAIASLAYLNFSTLFFLSAMYVGMLLSHFFTQSQKREI